MPAAIVDLCFLKIKSIKFLPLCFFNIKLLKNICVFNYYC